MSFTQELALTILGGIATSLILELFRSRTRGGQNQTITSARSGDGFFRQFFRLVLAVAGGVFIALFVGRFLFQNGILERSVPMRVGLLIGGTMLCWLLLLAFRRRR